MGVAYLLSNEIADFSNGRDFDVYLTEYYSEPGTINIASIGDTADYYSYAYSRADADYPSQNQWQAGEMSFYLQVTVGSNKTLMMRVRAQRINASGIVQESTSYSSAVDVTNVGQHSFTIPTHTWSAGQATDRLRIEFHYYRPDKPASASISIAVGHNTPQGLSSLTTVFSPQYSLQGSGTELDPYLISTVQELNDLFFFDDNSGTIYFKLNCDLDLTGSNSWHSGHGYIPKSFYGVLDGNGHTISNLFTNQYYRYPGLFGNVYGTVKNIILDNADINTLFNSDSVYVGGIAGFLRYDGRIEKCKVMNSTISANNGDSANHNFVSGIVGRSYVNDGYSTQDILIKECASVNNIFNSNNTFANELPGIINVVGDTVTNYAIRIEDCYALDNYFNVPVSATIIRIAGITYGYEINNLIVSRCYSANLIIQGNQINDDPMLIASSSTVTAIDNYYNLTNSTGFTASTYGTELTVAEMQNSVNFNNWDNINVWGWDSNINYGYPHLLAFIIITKPTINIISYTLDKISDEVGYQTSTVTFQSDQDLVEWEARADGTGHGSGLLVGSGGSVTANTDVTFDVDYTELTQGDKTYQINVYGKNSDGIWSDT